MALERLPGRSRPPFPEGAESTGSGESTTIINKVSVDVKEDVKELTQKPKSLKEYVAVGDRYG